MNAFLFTVPLPKVKSTRKYRVFKLVLTDNENGDKGEGLYYYIP